MCAGMFAGMCMSGNKHFVEAGEYALPGSLPGGGKLHGATRLGSCISHATSVPAPSSIPKYMLVRPRCSKTPARSKGQYGRAGGQACRLTAEALVPQQALPTAAHAAATAAAAANHRAQPAHSPPSQAAPPPAQRGRAHTPPPPLAASWRGGAPAGAAAAAAARPLPPALPAPARRCQRP